MEKTPKKNRGKGAKKGFLKKKGVGKKPQKKIFFFKFFPPQKKGEKKIF
ncbi:hypothetical protein ACFFWB_26795 [Flavobacterium procerum]